MTSQVLVGKPPGSVGTCISPILSRVLCLTKRLLLAKVVLFVIGVGKRARGEGETGGTEARGLAPPNHVGAPDMLSCLYIALRLTEMASVGRVREVF